MSLGSLAVVVIALRRIAESRNYKEGADEYLSLSLQKPALLVLPSRVFRMTRLRKLDISRNSLVSIPPEIGELVLLQVRALVFLPPIIITYTVAGPGVGRISESFETYPN